MTETFEHLVDLACKRAQRPMTRKALAEHCGISRQELYELMWGVLTPKEATVQKLVRGMALPSKRVLAALEVSRTMAMLR